MNYLTVNKNHLKNNKDKNKNQKVMQRILNLHKRKNSLTIYDFIKF